MWFDEGQYGGTIRKLKQAGVKVPLFAFYHVVHSEPILQKLKRDIFTVQGLKSLMVCRNYRMLQRLSAEYADLSLIINDRDREAFKRLYGNRPQFVLPICLMDKAKIVQIQRKPDEFNLIFIGAMKPPHMPNVEGIKWFAVNVMPHLDPRAVLYVVGPGTEALKDSDGFRGSDRIRILGRVESLDDAYNMADLSVVPIFRGEGMMTKVAEALMYGKNIAATTHALNGYDDIAECSRCDTAEEFIRKINGLIESGADRYNPAMRRIYEAKYSLNAMEDMLRGCFKERHII